MELLTALNTILPWMEENTVTSTDNRSPTVALILEKIDFNRRRILIEQYWFNTERKRFYLGEDGRVSTPNNALAMYPLNKQLNYEIRGEYIYDLDNGTFQIPSTFDAVLAVDLPFNELPEAAALVITWRSAIDAYAPDYKVDDTVRLLMDKETQARALLQREHLRKINVSPMRSKAGFRYLNSLRS